MDDVLMIYLAVIVAVGIICMVATKADEYLAKYPDRTLSRMLRDGIVKGLFS